MNDDAFLTYVGDRLGALPGVEAVTLGGSRAEGTNRPDSDWDFSIYYRGDFDPQCLRDLGWPGNVGELGSWSSTPNTVFNGGAWLTIDGRPSDVHYRDLDVIDRVIAEAHEGRFETEPLWFHLSGLPSYLVLAELAVKQVLTGELPDVAEYPPALREHAPDVWWRQAEAEFDYARRYHAVSGRLTQCVGLLARAATCTAHAVLAARGIWVTNEKQLFKHANLDEVDRILTTAPPEPTVLGNLVDRVQTFCAEAVHAARSTL
ncbi:MAG: nucleotidyltransferase domain-containing protein [Microbacteriaceae bacterium]|nr:nucleotidyltransferase domain-containing protein [Microbacteriaceae bacterium]